MRKETIKNKVGKVFNVKIDDINYFQRDLKELSVKNYEKLKNSIQEYGIISPGFVWESKGKLFALDCHQRLKTLKQMRSEGFPVPDKIPVVEIFAESKKEAKRYLLQYVSQHGKITEDGLYDFLHDAGLCEDIGDLDSELSLAGFDFEEFCEGYFGEDTGGDPETAGAGEEEEEIDEKFTFVVSKKDAKMVHRKLKKAENKISNGDGGQIFLEICRKY